MEIFQVPVDVKKILDLVASHITALEEFAI